MLICTNLSQTWHTTARIAGDEEYQGYLWVEPQPPDDLNNPNSPLRHDIVLIDTNDIRSAVGKKAHWDNMTWTVTLVTETPNLAKETYFIDLKRPRRRRKA